MTLIEDSVARTVNRLIDSFVDDGKVDFARQFSVPFPSEIFLGLLGLPFEELPRFLAMKDGIIPPHLAVGVPWDSPGRHEHRARTADSSTGTSTSCWTSVRPSVRTICSSPDSSMPRSTGERLIREDILDICFLFLIAGLDTVSATLDCIFGYLVTHPDHRRQIVDDPSLVPAAIEELLRWETRCRRWPGWRWRTPSWPAARSGRATRSPW